MAPDSKLLSRQEATMACNDFAAGLIDDRIDKPERQDRSFDLPNLLRRVLLRILGVRAQPLNRDEFYLRLCETNAVGPPRLLRRRALGSVCFLLGITSSPSRKLLAPYDGYKK